MTLREGETENEREPRAGEPQTPAHGENHQTDRSARSAGSDQSVDATLAPAQILMTQEDVQSLLAGSQSRLRHKDCEVVLYKDISHALPQMAKDADFSKRISHAIYSLMGYYIYGNTPPQSNKISMLQFDWKNQEIQV